MGFSEGDELFVADEEEAELRHPSVTLSSLIENNLKYMFLI